MYGGQCMLLMCDLIGEHIRAVAVSASMKRYADSTHRHGTNGEIGFVKGLFAGFVHACLLGYVCAVHTFLGHAD